MAALHYPKEQGNEKGNDYNLGAGSSVFASWGGVGRTSSYD